jgi:hypothetical protein
MCRLARFLVLCIVCLSLPLQAVAAVAMPFCDGAGQAPAEASGHVGHAMAMEHDDHGDMHVPSDVAFDGHDGASCNQCGLCHLACCPAVAGTAAPLTMSDVLHSVYQATPQHGVTFFQPDLFLRPPRRDRA